MELIINPKKGDHRALNVCMRREIFPCLSYGSPDMRSDPMFLDHFMKISGIGHPHTPNETHLFAFKKSPK